MIKVRAYLGLSFIICILALATLTVGTKTVFAQVQSSDQEQLALIRKIAVKVVSEVRASREIYSWEIYGMRDRVPNYCIDQCLCISNKMIAEFKKNGIFAHQIFVNPAKNSYGVKIRGAKPTLGILKAAIYDYHVATVIRLNKNWVVIDPVVFGGPRLEWLSDWKTRMETPVHFTLK